MMDFKIILGIVLLILLSGCIHGNQNTYQKGYSECLDDVNNIITGESDYPVNYCEHYKKDISDDITLKIMCKEADDEI